MSAVVEEPNRKDNFRPDIISSQDEPEALDYNNWEGRLFFGLTSVVTVTETLTSVTFTTSSVTKTLSTKFAAAKAITCIPSGFFIC